MRFVELPNGEIVNPDNVFSISPCHGFVMIMSPFGKEIRIDTDPGNMNSSKLMTTEIKMAMEQAISE